MSDLFISYSRHDSARALELADQLRAWGIDVWIDTQGIDASDQWPKEIVQAIWGCKAFIILISESSLASTNVLRELSLAIEKQKPVLPLKLSAVSLNEDFAYHLAGVQRIAVTDFDAIERSLRKWGIEKKFHPENDAAPIQNRIQKRDVKSDRLSLIVLPFEDFSPAGEDNLWFADGLAGELIDALSHIKSLHILDRKTSLALRSVRLRTAEIAKEYNTQYFIEGTVRKFGDEIKISVALLDILSGDYLWQDSLRGKFQEIFDLQESVAKSVVEALKLHLTKEETLKLREHGTNNADAYALYVKAQEYFDRHTREGFDYAVKLASEAIALDPSYADACVFKADALANISRIYHIERGQLREALALTERALELQPDLWSALAPRSLVYQLEGELSLAEDAAKRYVANAPHDARSHFRLGAFYDANGNYDMAIAPYSKAVELKPEYLPYIWNMVLAYHHAGHANDARHKAVVALPLFERHLKFLPEDEFHRACYASLLHFAERDADARNYASNLFDIHDGTSLYSLACLYCELGDYQTGIDIFQKALLSGYRNQAMLQRFLSSEKSGIASLKGTEMFEETRTSIARVLEQR